MFENHLPVETFNGIFFQFDVPYFKLDYCLGAQEHVLL